MSLLRTMNSLAQSSKQAHNQGMKTYAGIVLALAFCASAFASDPGKNAVARPTQQIASPAIVKICYIKTVASGIPMRCERLVGTFPTTANPLLVIGRE